MRLGGQTGARLSLAARATGGSYDRGKKKGPYGGQGGLSDLCISPNRCGSTGLGRLFQTMPQQDNDAAAYQLQLNGRRRGKIWSHKPRVDADGTILIAANGEFRKEQARVSPGSRSSSDWGYLRPLAAFGGGVQMRGMPDIGFRVAVWDENSMNFACADDKGQVSPNKSGGHPQVPPLRRFIVAGDSRRCGTEPAEPCNWKT
jgi:hypothetical protein